MLHRKIRNYIYIPFNSTSQESLKAILTLRSEEERSQQESFEPNKITCEV